MRFDVRSITTALVASFSVFVIALAAASSGCSTGGVQRVQNPAEEGAPGTLAGHGGYVYTANERGGSISVIDLRTGRVNEVAVRIMPHNVQTSHDGHLLLAVGSVGGMDRMGDGSATKMKIERGRLLILDTETLANGHAADIEIGRDPAHVIIDQEGKFAYADNSKDDDVLIVDVARRKVVGEIKTGAFPHGLRMSPDGQEIYVACVNDNSVSVINVAESKEVARIPVGRAPVQVGFLPSGRRVYVSVRDEDSVAVVDTVQRKKIATIPVGRKPIQVFASPEGRYMYVAHQVTETNPDHTVSVIETSSNRVVATIATGRGAHGVVVSDDGSRAFVANTFESTVSIIDTATKKVISNIKVGEGSGGITFRAARR